MDIYSLIQTHVVSQMTPVITLTSIETIAGTPVKYKLFSCNTQWVTINDKITIDGVVYKVVSFVQDEYLIVTGPSAPVQLYLQLPAPTFEHGTHRRVSSERVKKAASKRIITPMIYALPVKGKTRPSIDSMYGFSGKVRFFCLTTFDKNGDATIATQQKNVVNPMSALVRYFIQKFEERLDLFEEIQEVFQDDFMDFGDPAIWGAKERIFEEFLSGVGVNFDLNIYSQDECCTDTPAVSCLPVKFQIEGVLAETLPSGQTFNLNLIDTDGNVPAHTYDATTDTLEVAAGGGGSASIDISLNSNLVFEDQTTNLDIEIVDSTDSPTGNWNGTKFEIDNSTININTVEMVSTPPASIVDLLVKKSDGTTNTGSKVGANWQIADVTQTLNGVAITNNKAETSKAITIRYANNDPVPVTTITDTETVFIGEVPNPLNTSNPFKTGQTTSYVANDDGALERGNGVSFTALSHNNYFGNTNRFTDDLGGQTYTSGWVIDWATWNQVTGDFIMWYKTAQTGATWANAIAGQPYNVGGFADCYLPNATEIGQLYNFGLASALNYAPFNYTVAGTASNLWTTTTVPSATTTAIAFQGLVVEAARAKTLVIAFFVMRYGNISEL